MTVVPVIVLRFWMLRLRHFAVLTIWNDSEVSPPCGIIIIYIISHIVYIHILYMNIYTYTYTRVYACVF